MLSAHRDVRRRNKANMAVRASIISKINISSIDKIKFLVTDDPQSILNNPDRIHKLLDIASKTSAQSRELFIQSQSEINSQTLDEYSSSQHTHLVKSVTYKEDYKLVQTISKFIVTEDMVNMIRNVVWGRCNQSGKRNFL